MNGENVEDRGSQRFLYLEEVIFIKKIYNEK